MAQNAYFLLTRIKFTDEDRWATLRVDYIPENGHDWHRTRGEALRQINAKLETYNNVEIVADDRDALGAPSVVFTYGKNKHMRHLVAVNHGDLATILDKALREDPTL